MARMTWENWKCLLLLLYAFLVCVLLVCPEVFQKRKGNGVEEAFQAVLDSIAAMGRDHGAQAVRRRELAAGELMDHLRPWLATWQGLRASRVSAALPREILDFERTVGRRIRAICTATNAVIQDVFLCNVVEDESKVFFLAFQGDLLTSCAEAADAIRKWWLLSEAQAVYRNAWTIANISLEESNPLRRSLNEKFAYSADNV